MFKIVYKIYLNSFSVTDEPKSKYRSHILSKQSKHYQQSKIKKPIIPTEIQKWALSAH